MKLPILLALSITFIAPLMIAAQTGQPQVKGIKVGTHYSAVIRKLGKPLSIKKGGTFPCDDDGKMVTTRYHGLIFKFIKSNLDHKLIVASVKITSPKWPVFGIRIGDKMSVIRAKFPGELYKDKEDGFDVLGGFYNEGFSGFYFRHQRLVKISWEFNIC